MSAIRVEDMNNKGITVYYNGQIITKGLVIAGEMKAGFIFVAYAIA